MDHSCTNPCSHGWDCRDGRGLSSCMLFICCKATVHVLLHSSKQLNIQIQSKGCYNYISDLWQLWALDCVCCSWRFTSRGLEMPERSQLVWWHIGKFMLPFCKGFASGNPNLDLCGCLGLWVRKRLKDIRFFVNSQWRLRGCELREQIYVFLHSCSCLFLLIHVLGSILLFLLKLLWSTRLQVSSVK
jgi:hypothetical protein